MPSRAMNMPLGAEQQSLGEHIIKTYVCQEKKCSTYLLFSLEKCGECGYQWGST